MQIKLFIILTALIVFPLSAVSGPLTIDQCQEKAKLNYPQIKQFELIEKSSEYSLSNAGKAYLPKISLSGMVTYQSDVISLDLTLPSNNTVSIHQDKDQYKAVLEVNQILWDGGVTAKQKNIVRANAEIEKQKLEVDLYTIKDRVNQLYFGLLLINEQLQQNAILQKELQTNYDKVKAYMQNGVANQSDLDAVKLEQLNNNQRRTELCAVLKSYLEMLSAMTGEKIETITSLEKPVIVTSNLSGFTINRPELKLFESQLNLIDNQSQMIHAVNMPKFGLFVQSGIGKPGLNMLKNDVSPYYIGGLRFSWDLSGFYTQKNNLSSLKINKDMIAAQKETFLFNNNLKINQQNNEIEKMKELIKSDDEIIRLHTSIKEACSAKVENGVQTVTELLREMNAENLSKLQKSWHEMQLMMSIYNLKYSTNN